VQQNAATRRSALALGHQCSLLRVHCEPASTPHANVPPRPNGRGGTWIGVTTAGYPSGAARSATCRARAAGSSTAPVR
jgi:hypothetical protein